MKVYIKSYHPSNRIDDYLKKHFDDWNEDNKQCEFLNQSAFNIMDILERIILDGYNVKTQWLTSDKFESKKIMVWLDNGNFNQR